MSGPARLLNVPLIAEMDPAAAATLLEEMGDYGAAEDMRHDLARPGTQEIFGWGKPKPWQYTARQIGYMAPREPGSAGAHPIHAVGTVSADDTLKNKRINVHLQRLRVYAYPGSGMHYVMLTFKAQNQLRNAPEPVGFNQTYRVQGGQQAGVLGYPIFIGLNVGALGVAFQAATINVKNESDERMLGFLNSAPFTTGLNLLSTAQPVLKPFTEMATGLANMVASRNKNVAVEEIYLGLDFTSVAMGARLAVGDYIVVQVPQEGAINWDDWQFDAAVGGIVSKATPSSGIPYNYFVFSITRYEE